MSWLFVGGLAASIIAVLVSPANVIATPFASPTPASSQINQPFITFQKGAAIPRLTSLDDNVPAFLVIFVLIFLLALVVLYLSFLRPKH